MSPIEGLRIEHATHTLRVTIDRDDANRFTPQMVAALADELETATDDRSLRFVHLRATGPSFCLGRETPGDGPPEIQAVRALATNIVRVNELLQRSPLVSIAEVGGDAAGFGAGLVGNADIAVAADGARFSFPEIAEGFAPTIVMSWLSYKVPRKRAFDAVSSGLWLDAEQALLDGLITEVVSEGGLESRVRERLDGLSSLSAGALRDIKRFAYAIRDMPPGAAASASIDALALGVVDAARRRETEDGM